MINFRLADNGMWSCCLLPCIAILTALEERCWLQASILLSLVCYLCYDGWKTNIATVLSLLACIVHILWSLSTLTEGVGCFLACCMLFTYLLWWVPARFQHSFTFGELTVVLQLYLSLMYRVLNTILSKSQPEDSLDKVTVVVFLGVHVAVLSMYVLKLMRLSPLLFWFAMVAIGLSYILASVISGMLELQALFMKVIYPNLSVVCFWCAWVILTLLVVCWHGPRYRRENTYYSHQNETEAGQYSSCQATTDQGIESDIDSKYRQIKDAKHSVESDKHSFAKTVYGGGDVKVQDDGWLSSSVRKYFHIAMLGVYLPGLMLCPDLLFVASHLVAAVLVLLEAVRVLKIGPVADILDEYLNVFLDAQDSGVLILTPIYLLVGCSAPLWWEYKQQSSLCTLAMYSGLVSVGVGDSVASVFGRKFGRHKWPGSKKSIEGTSAAAISQILAIQCLHMFNVSGAVVTLATVTCVILVSLLEAFTTQIDNLIVPIFAWLLFKAVESR